MSKNVFKKWEPLVGLSDEMYLEELHQNYEGLRLLLTDSGEQERTLQIIFDAALTYKNIDEGDLLFYNRIDGEDGLGRWGFFTIDRSDYLECFHLVSQDIHKRENIVHYAIYTPNDCLDILSAYPPSVEWIS